jgi:hypothetical protein
MRIDQPSHHFPPRHPTKPMEVRHMLTNDDFAAAGDILAELSDSEIDLDAAQAAGGLFTVPGTSTIGYVCTYSYECSFPKRLCGIGD